MRLPESGDVVELVWLDSGLRLMGASEDEARQASLALVRLWGRVVCADEEQIVLAQEVDEDDTVGQYGIVWTPCVKEIRWLREGPSLTETLEDIVESVESQSSTETTTSGVRLLGHMLDEGDLEFEKDGWT